MESVPHRSPFQVWAKCTPGKRTGKGAKPARGRQLPSALPALGPFPLAIFAALQHITKLAGRWLASPVAQHWGGVARHRRSPSSLGRREILRPNLLFDSLWHAANSSWQHDHGRGRASPGHSRDAGTHLQEGPFPNSALRPVQLCCCRMRWDLVSNFRSVCLRRRRERIGGGWSQQYAFMMGGIREIFGFILMPGLLQGLEA